METITPEKFRMIKGNHQNKEYLKEFVDAIEKERESRLYLNKMIYLKTNYKELTKGCEDIPANWPSFGVTSVRIGQVEKKVKKDVSL